MTLLRKLQVRRSALQDGMLARCCRALFPVSYARQRDRTSFFSLQCFTHRAEVHEELFAYWKGASDLELAAGLKQSVQRNQQARPS